MCVRYGVFLVWCSRCNLSLFSHEDLGYPFAASSVCTVVAFLVNKSPVVEYCTHFLARAGVFLAAASRGWAGWTPPPLPPVAGHGWPKMAGGEIWPKSRKTKKKRPHLGSLGVQANPF